MPDDAEVSEQDKATSPRFWAKYATDLLKRLLRAKEEKDGTAV